jgi:hypothetical protein
MASVCSLSVPLVLAVITMNCGSRTDVSNVKPLGATASADGGTRDAASTVDAPGDARACVGPGCSLDEVVMLEIGAPGDPGSDTGLTWTFNGKEWTDQNIVGPSGLQGAMAHLNGELVYVGGKQSPGTWTFNGTTWTQLAAMGPPESFFGVMAPLNGTLVYVGSASDTTTWTFDGTTWTSLAVAGPSARSGAAMAPLGGRLILFGGYPDQSAKSGALSDTWAWDGASWTELSVGGPQARDGSVMAPLGSQLVLFGGSAGQDVDTDVAFGDTWLFNGTGWSLFDKLGTGVSPRPRSHALLAPLDGKLVLFGGESRSATTGLDVSSEDTWFFDGTTWANYAILGPAPTCCSVMANL